MYPETSLDVNPVLILASWETKDLSIAKQGLKEGLRDSISNLKEFPKEVIASINADLERDALPNIFKLINTINETLKKVLRSGKIKNTDQFYIVDDVLSDTSVNIPPEDKKKLSKYLRDFEHQIRIKQ
jgi:hypothetical protein